MGGIIGRDAQAMIRQGWQRALEALEFFRESATLIQIAVAAVVVITGFGVGRLLERRLEARVRSIQSGPRAMRFMAPSFSAARTGSSWRSHSG